MPEWTEDQTHAIEARGGSIIVGAAAGSGKTAVLVERVIRLLTDEKDPVNADELLIVTFTKAATSEMRTRIAEALEKRLKEDPESKNLQRQKILLPSAKICTIDSFCSGLVRENFDKLDLPIDYRMCSSRNDSISGEHVSITPDFRILDEAEEKILKSQAVDSVVSEFYEDPSDIVFQNLSDLLSSGRDDSDLNKYILQLYNYSLAFPSPGRWLNQSLDAYRAENIKDSDMVKKAQSQALDLIKYLKNKEAQLIHAFEDMGMTSEKIWNQTQEEYNNLQKIEDALKEYDFKEAVSLGSAAQYDTRARLIGDAKKENNFVNLDNYGKDIRKLIKTGTTNKLPAMLPVGIDETIEDASHILPLAGKLVEAVHKTDIAYSQLKQEQNSLDFTDLEHLTLRLLVEDPGAENPVPTPFAEEVGKQYREILIDECQDTNRLQDMIFRSIAHRDESRTMDPEDNLFMVGDVKQSIYRFRQASPELFLERQKRYSEYEEEFPASITLKENFRSREGVLDAVNFVFRQLMSEEIGDVDYGEDDELNFGNKDFEPRDEADTEFHLIDTGNNSAGNEIEAEYVARYILKEKKDKGLKWNDFAILLASPKSHAAEYRKALLKYGIPVYSDNGGSFLKTADVQVVLSILRIIDNPLQDIPLLSVLLSPISGFTPNEVATIRNDHNKEPIYLNLKKAAKDGNDKCEEFLQILQHYRALAVSLPAGDLLREIYEDTAYPSAVHAMPNGVQRAANLHLLLENADKYDSFSSNGLSGFIRYVDKMEENNHDMSPASPLSPNADVVHIMSIHKSKGLQFKVCILAATANKFNDSDQRENIILHPELGIGLKYRDLETGAIHPTLYHTVLKNENLRRSRSESLRVLYVAMTRAKEKLVMTAAIKGLGNNVVRCGEKLSQGEKCDAYPLYSSLYFSDWLIMALLRYPGDNPLRDLYCKKRRISYSASVEIPDIKIDTKPKDIKIVIADAEDFINTDSKDSGENNQGAQQKDNSNPTDVELETAKQINARISYTYLYQPLTQTPSKRTASKSGEKEFSALNFASAKPEFLSKGGLTSAERGTALHKFMQYMDFAAGEQEVENELERVAEKGLLSAEEKDVIQLDKVKAFFASPLYQRMKKSPQVMREKQFAVLLPANTFDASLPEQSDIEPVLVQGVVDCAFEEDGKLVILDYKTDHVKEAQELVDLYSDQLHIYANAMREITGMQVSELVLYSFSLGREVQIPLTSAE